MRNDEEVIGRRGSSQQRGVEDVFAVLDESRGVVEVVLCVKIKVGDVVTKGQEVSLAAAF